MADEFQLQGVDELVKKLREIPLALRKRVLRNALAAGARLVRDEAKQQAPVLRLENSLQAPYRKPGTVRDAVRIRTSKKDRRAGDVGVYVNVKPAKGAERGAKSRADPFYWRFLEFGTKRMAPRKFLRPAADKLSAALPIIQQSIVKWFDKTNAAGKVQP